MTDSKHLKDETPPRPDSLAAAFGRFTKTPEQARLERVRARRKAREEAIGRASAMVAMIAVLALLLLACAVGAYELLRWVGLV
jgi:hypothetical protein